LFARDSDTGGPIARFNFAASASLGYIINNNITIILFLLLSVVQLLHVMTEDGLFALTCVYATLHYSIS